MNNKELIERIDSYLNLDWDSPIDSVGILLNCKKALQDAEAEAKKQAATHLHEESKLSELINDQSFAIDQRDRLLEVRLQEINRLKAELEDEEETTEMLSTELVEVKSKLSEQVEELNAYRQELINFIAKCDNGEARSVRSYTSMKNVLEQFKKES